MYIEHLPMESATQTAQLASLDDREFTEVAAHEQTYGPWSHTDLLLAAVADAIERLTFVQLRRAGVTPSMPKPIPRPGVQAKVRAINPAAAAYLNNLRAKEG